MFQAELHAFAGLPSEQRCLRSRIVPTIYIVRLLISPPAVFAARQRDFFVRPARARLQIPHSRQWKRLSQNQAFSRVPVVLPTTIGRTVSSQRTPRNTTFSYQAPHKKSHAAPHIQDNHPFPHVRPHNPIGVLKEAPQRTRQQIT
jgi:hypothetical protein